MKKAILIFLIILPVYAMEQKTLHKTFKTKVGKAELATLIESHIKNNNVNELDTLISKKVIDVNFTIKIGNEQKKLSLLDYALECDALESMHYLIKNNALIKDHTIEHLKQKIL